MRMQINKNKLSYKNNKIVSVLHSYVSEILLRIEYLPNSVIYRIFKIWNYNTYYPASITV